MTTAMQVMLKLQGLSEDQQRQVLEFMEKLLSPTPSARPSLYVLLEGYDITDEDIAEARREMWGNSPGDDF